MGLIKRNSIGQGDFELRILEKNEYYKLGSFDCDNSDLNEFFSEDIFRYKEHLLAETYSFEYKGDRLALVSFCNDSVELEKLPRSRREKI